MPHRGARHGFRHRDVVALRFCLASPSRRLGARRGFAKHGNDSGARGIIVICCVRIVGTHSSIHFHTKLFVPRPFLRREGPAHHPRSTHIPRRPQPHARVAPPRQHRTVGQRKQTPSAVRGWRRVFEFVDSVQGFVVNGTNGPVASAGGIRRGGQPPAHGKRGDGIGNIFAPETVPPARDFQNPVTRPAGDVPERDFVLASGRPHERAAVAVTRVGSHETAGPRDRNRVHGRGRATRVRPRRSDDPESQVAQTEHPGLRSKRHPGGVSRGRVLPGCPPGPGPRSRHGAGHRA
mmetsp:Transcript_181/g.661  ORF Transcript_181/g.661 Transcript_181/m.661 type:complete len:292 (-) Transcript_181:1551-2426(-)